MTREEIVKRFNDMPREHRTTSIGYNLENEIRVLEHQKIDVLKRHKKHMNDINVKIHHLMECLNQLKED